MDESGPTLENKEDVWRTWFRELGGTYWTVPENMPPAARTPWNNFCHYRNNPSQDPSGSRMAKAAAAFKQATDSDAEEVYQFMLSLK